MDAFDDFEMKPITEGLGFHKKAINLKKGPEELYTDQNEPNNQAIDQSIKRAADSLDALFSESSDLNIIETIEPSIHPNSVPQPQPQPQPRPNVSYPPTSGLTITEEVTPDAGTRRSAPNDPRSSLMQASVSISSSLLDGVVVLAISLIFLTSLLMIVEVNLNRVLNHLGFDIMTQISMGVIYLAVLLVYVVLSRSFFGRTLGEWTFDYQMGSDNEIHRVVYPLKVIWRSLLIIMTGVVVLPFLSLVVGKDVASYFSGLQLYRKSS